MVHPVYFYAPNIVGYARIILSLISYAYAFTDWVIFTTLYAISYILDAVDGPLARHLGQTSRFGAVLDMVADRSSTACLLAVLAHFYPDFVGVYLGLLSLDVISHFAHVYAACLTGKSHKKIDPKQNWILRKYYDPNSYMLFWMCVGNEACFIVQYVLHFSGGANLVTAAGYDVGFFHILFLVTLPICVTKQIISVIQFFDAVDEINAFEDNEKANRSK
eukprot:GFYU01000566.1.p1 GENE.GFYU01000566.1~~GFYU01000566.1.p1  ORF type:complete len:227 (-),score=11.18 GFYU01000566.1:22-678(-)